MKSFRQKIEEKRIILEKERLLQEEQSNLLRQQQESDRLERQRIAKEKEAIQWEREQQLYESRLYEQSERKRLNEIRLDKLEEDRKFKLKIANEQQEWRDKIEFRSKQKSIIQDILDGERKVRTHVIQERDRIESELAQERYSQEHEKLQLELEEKERIQLVEMERIEAETDAEQAKYALWERLEKEEQARKEQETLEYERIQSENESLKETALMLERVQAERIEYDERQSKIAEAQKESRIEINKILAEASDVLYSNTQTSLQSRLSGLHDYIYRLNTNKESDPWTNRKQPMSILPWADWKQIPANESLIETDFKRARLLFEQDNMRAKRYHAHIWHEMPARNLTIQRKQQIDIDGKLTGLPYEQLVSSRQELVEAVGGIQYWLDAKDLSSIDTLVTASIGTASISCCWVNNPGVNSANAYIEGVNGEFNNSASLVISGANALFDGNRDTYMSIKHTSGSEDGVYDYDWNSPNTNILAKLSGVIYIRVQVPEEYQDKIVERIELSSLDRKFIPTNARVYMHKTPTVGNQVPRFERHQIYSGITGSFSGANTAQVVGGSESGSSRQGGPYGITSEGSASLDPLLVGGLYPREIFNIPVYGGGVQSRFYDTQFALRINVAATGSELRFNELKIWYQAPSGSAISGQGIHVMRSKEVEGAHPSASRWMRAGSSATIESRLKPLGYPVYHATSPNQPDGIDMPYIQFSSQSMGALSSRYEHGDYKLGSGFTQFWCAKDTSGPYSTQNCWYYDAGQTYKTQQLVAIEGHHKGLKCMIKDWDGIDDANSINTTCFISVQANLGGGTEPDLYGRLASEKTSSTIGWPYTGDTGNYSPFTTGQLHGMMQLETSTLTLQLDNPGEISSSRYRMWHKGGTPFVDMDQSPVTDYAQTASLFGEPQLGSIRNQQWGDFQLHELITFDKVLSKTEIDTVNNYLSAKWKLNYYPVNSDADDDFVYGVSSSISTQDIWTFDGTDATATDNVYSSSAWEIS